MTAIVLFAPLVGALICAFAWRLVGEEVADWTATGLLGLAALLSWIVFFTLGQETQHIQILRWIESGSLAADWSIRLDRLTAIMMVVVTTVSTLVHVYSVGYMAHDENFREGEAYRARFFAYLSFFTFAMLALVTADNLAQLFFGWEGVGLASYLLIGFYFRRPQANAAAIKAFVVNRVGDFGFLLGIFALFFLVDSLQFDDIFASARDIADTQITFLWRQWNAAEVVSILLFVGAMGKSAQLFLHTWLPDAMEGPTPVSALIHAATMVTAGVFLVCRMSPIIEFAPGAQGVIVAIGAATAFVTATIGLVQMDIKRVIAYSTCSQLGYMFVAAGVGVYSAAMFHLFTHAFFKAMLFLGSGSVIHGMHHEQDMRAYGGLRHKMPYTFWAMMIGTLALTGVGIPFTQIGFAGFVSKDAIVESSWAGAPAYAFWLLVIGAALTAFYSWRLMFLTFFGSPRGDRETHAHAHESPWVMVAPLGVLALGATFAGTLWYNVYFGDHESMLGFFGVPEAEVTESAGGASQAGEEQAAAEGGDEAAGESRAAGAAPGAGAIYMSPQNGVLEAAHGVSVWVKVAPFLAMLVGFGLAWLMYIREPGLADRLARNQRPAYLFLWNKWYFDELYAYVFVRPARWVARQLWRRGDGGVIDGAINGLAMGAVPFFTRLAGRAQSGYIFHYAFAIVIGAAILITWATLGVGL